MSQKPYFNLYVTIRYTTRIGNCFTYSGWWNGSTYDEKNKPALYHLVEIPEQIKATMEGDEDSAELLEAKIVAVEHPDVTKAKDMVASGI